MSQFNMDDIIYTVKNGAYKASEGAKDIAKDIADKSEGFMTRVKLQYSIRAIKSSIEEAYADLGEYVYDEFADEEIEGPIKDKCQRITKLYREYKALTDELCASKNAVMCSSCGAINDTENKYCSECGAPLK